MSNTIAPGSSADVNVKVTALTTNSNVPVTYKTIILKKNLVNGVNTLTQEMMSATNTKYVIKYDYVLGEDITVPDNCILEFDGGSISGNNTLTLTKTHISGIINILSKVTGTIDNSSIDITWFGCKSSQNWEAENDCTERLQLCVDLAFASQCAIFIPVGDFVVNNTVYLHSGTIMKGIHGYTFKASSRLCTGIQSDDDIMFKQKNSQGELDSIRHCTFEGITFCRNRTSEERAGGLGNGEGYGFAGTIFEGFTELRLLNCGVFGFGNVFYHGAICFCDHTDFGYTNTIIKGGTTSGTSTIYIENANIWCCGNIITLNGYGIDELVVNNVWIEYAQSFCSGEISTKVTNIIANNMWFTNAGYNTNPNLIDLKGEVNPNTPTFVFKNCSIKNKGQICKSVNPATSVNITFEDCYLIYGGDYSLETCNIYGNSILRDYQNDYNFVGTAANKGIDNHYGIIHNGLAFKKQSDKLSRGEFAIFRADNNILQFFDSNNNREMLLHAYWLTGDANDVTNPQQSIYLTINTAPSGDADVLTLHNKVTGQKYVFKNSNSTYGPTESRPTRMVNGDMYFDTTLDKPIWVVRDQWGTPRWVDATGTTI